jgi:SAM-dependent methyltransferase
VQARKGLIRQIVDNARHRQGAQVGQNYKDFAVQNLLRAHLPVRPDWSVIEIGCAPGNNLVNLHRMFGYEPHGIEYCHSRVISTLETFRRHGFNTANVIEADFFDQEFHNRFRGHFDVVFSGGFIEHFDPPDEALNLHVNLLKPGGYLICAIPNLLGIFYPFLWLCARDHLAAHNCKVMRKDSFRRVFEPFGLEMKFCGYIGAFQFYGTSLKYERSLRGVAASALDRFQDILDHCMFLFYRGNFPESRLSASLAFVGRRMS